MKTSILNRVRTSLIANAAPALFLFVAGPLGLTAERSAGTDDPLVRQLGVSRGICAVVGDSAGAVALQLARKSELIVYTQVADAAAVEKIRRLADEAGFYGRRVYVEQGPTSRLHLADNVADALWAGGEAVALPETEALRVIRPRGKAILGQREVVKAVPLGLDDWSHPYHLPDNNPLSRDQVARGPYLTQFLADPRYAPLPQVAVASAGRVFKAFGHIAFKTREEPWLNTLAAFNGYNGTLLWRREIAKALMVHRNTLIATPEVVYFGDDKSCKVFDAATGAPRDEIAPPAEVAGGTFWKWMALENGILYALIGDQEQRDPEIRAKMENHGWPWDPLSPGFNQKENPWGFGRTLVAIDPKTKKVLWRHQETEPIDSRALCMKSGRLFAFRFGDYLTCLDVRTGKEIWRKTGTTEPELFSELGDFQNRQDWRTNWRTTSYLKCTDQALYFAGPPIGKLLAVSTETGRVMWQYPYNNYQLVIRDDGLYALPGQIDKDPARKFDLQTGRVIEEFPLGRRACTRVTGSVDALFCRANGGSTRLNVASNRPELVSPMRPNCHDGVTVANGLLYWWPSVCDCNLTLYGITCLGPAGEFDFDRSAVESERLTVFAGQPEPEPGLAVSAADWPVFRANIRGTVTTGARVPAQVRRLWEHTASEPAGGFEASTLAAPVAAGGLVFVAGADGIVRALDANSGAVAWKAYTGGDVRYPPSVWNGRVFVGSGDGCVYAFAAKTGRGLWRFRAAPVERRIPVYGTLQSTWPVGSGVLVADGVVYCAAGIVNYDGTHVYALDAATGRIKWQNNSAGHLDAEAHTGISVQGHMVLNGDKLYLAGGNAVSPAVFDARDGKCLNEPQALRQRVNNNVPGSFSPRGNELYCVGDRVMVSGKPHYAHPKYPVYDAQVFNKTLLAPAGERAIAWVNNSRLLCFAGSDSKLATKVVASWGKPRVPDTPAAWETDCKGSLALAVAPNAVVVAKAAELAAYNLADGRQLWSQPLPAAPVPWGLCVDREGRTIVTLENGKVLCFGEAPAVL